MRRRPSIERTNIGQPCSIEGCRGLQTFSDRDVCRAHAVEEDERRAGEDLVARVAALAGRDEAPAGEHEYECAGGDHTGECFEQEANED